MRNPIRALRDVRLDHRLGYDADGSAGRGYGNHKRFVWALNELRDDVVARLRAQGMSEKDISRILARTESKLWLLLRDQSRWLV